MRAPMMSSDYQNFVSAIQVTLADKEAATIRIQPS